MGGLDEVTAKRRPSLSPAQLVFSLEPPAAPRHIEAELAGLDRMVAAGVARAMREDRRSRYEIGGAVSALLDEDVSKMMLDAYSAEGKEGHNISVHRFLALIAVTEQYDVLDALVRRIGAAVLVGDELHTARVGHLKSQIAELSAELRTVERLARPIKRGSGSR